MGMGIIGWIILGGIAGWLATAVMGRSQGCLVSVGVGVVGAVLGGLIFRVIGGAGVTGFNVWSFFVAFVGAVILLVVVRAVSRA